MSTLSVARRFQGAQSPERQEMTNRRPLLELIREAMGSGIEESWLLPLWKSEPFASASGYLVEPIGDN